MPARGRQPLPGTAEEVTAVRRGRNAIVKALESPLRHRNPRRGEDAFKVVISQARELHGALVTELGTESHAAQDRIGAWSVFSALSRALLEQAARCGLDTPEAEHFLELASKLDARAAANAKSALELATRFAKPKTSDVPWFETTAEDPSDDREENAPEPKRLRVETP